jgi:hypothetical protein
LTITPFSPPLKGEPLTRLASPPDAQPSSILLSKLRRCVSAERPTSLTTRSRSEAAVTIRQPIDNGILCVTISYGRSTRIPRQGWTQPFCRLV